MLPQGFYYHYKHDPEKDFNNYSYEVLGIARDSEKENSFTVIYRPLYEGNWLAPADYQARPYDMFIENVTVSGNTIPRFRLITNSEIIEKLEVIKKEKYLK